MKTKRVFALIICAVLLLSMIPAGTLAVSAEEGEGDWTVWHDPAKYETADWDEIVKPDPGYEYTEDGFSTIAPDWTNFTPFFTVQTKEAQPLKKGFYMQIRVDDYPYGGGNGADHWISFHLSDREGVIPGSIDYGNNWLCLLRGEGNGVTAAQSFLTTMSTDEKVGSFAFQGGPQIEVPMDDEGREIYTLEVIWNGRDYELKINGFDVTSQAISDSLKTWIESGEYYVGITMHSAVKDASAGLTILKYGTCEADAVTPVGSDYKEPEENGFVIADIEDPFTVPENQPAILWSPETYDLRYGENISFSVQGDGTWRATINDSVASWHFKAKNSWSYSAVDFPVFGILARDFWVENGTLWYSAGDITDAAPFNVYQNSAFYGADDEYIFIPIDMTGMWEGRINYISLDIGFEDDSFREFDICFAGMFRSVEEAYNYAEEYLVERGILTESVSETDPVVEPDPDPDDSKPDDSKPDDSKPDDSKPDGSENKVPEPENAESETLDDMEFIMTTLGCTGSVGSGAVLVLLIGAVLLKKKEN